MTQKAQRKHRSIICKRCHKIFLANVSRVVFCPDCRLLKWKLWKKTKNWERSEKGRAYNANYFKKRNQILKEQVFSHYGWACSCCNEKLKSMLVIDHVNNDGFIDRKKRLSGITFYNKIINSNFSKIYQVLCMNCNWSKRVQNGICEHKK